METSKYYLENAIGERISLNVDGDYFIHNVDGLGASMSSTYADIDNGFFNENKRVYPQDSIIGEIVFVRNAFVNYRTIIDFITESDALFFVYCPYGSEEYYRRCKLQSIGKGQRDGSGLMRCELTLTALTPWYLPTPLKLNFTDSSTNAIQYNVTRYGDSTRYASTYADNYAVDITAGGHLPSAISVTFVGAAVNPAIVLRNSNGIIGKCLINKTFTSGQSFTLSTDYRNSYVKDGTGADLIEYVDITNEPFFRIPLNEPCTLSIEASDVLTGTATADIYYYYRSI